MKRRHREYKSRGLDPDVRISLSGLSASDQALTVMVGLLHLGLLEVQESLEIYPIPEDNTLRFIIRRRGQQVKLYDAIGVTGFYDVCGLIAAHILTAKKISEGAWEDGEDADPNPVQDGLPF